MSELTSQSSFMCLANVVWISVREQLSLPLEMSIKSCSEYMSLFSTKCCRSCSWRTHTVGNCFTKHMQTTLQTQKQIWNYLRRSYCSSQHPRLTICFNISNILKSNSQVYLYKLRSVTASLTTATFLNSVPHLHHTVVLLLHVTYGVHVPLSCRRHCKSTNHFTCGKQML